jgi:hypothetical protein
VNYYNSQYLGGGHEEEYSGKPLLHMGFSLIQKSHLQQ